MRIISGCYGGRRLNVPKGRDIRPTSDKIRGAMFNMLASRGAVDGANVLDAFCGSGALGLEALSRGAAHCRFFDKARGSLALAQENAQMLGAEADCEFLIRDSLSLSVLPESAKKVSLVFLDPPYYQGAVSKALDGLVEGGWLEKGAWIMCESEKAFDMVIPAGFSCEAQKIYGDIKLVLLCYVP